MDDLARQPVRVRVRVHGRVQGVFFRDSCRREAFRRGVAGWVRNADDGTVEAVFEGQAADVEAMCRWCQAGPEQAEVERVETENQPPTRAGGFTVLG